MSSIAQIREAAYDMKPLEAVDYLLGVIEQSLPVFAAKDHPVDRWGVHLPRSERLIAATLFDRAPNVVARDELFDMIYSTKPAGDVPDPKIIRALICRLRKRIPACRGKIVCHWGRGYSFQKWDKERGYV